MSVLKDALSSTFGSPLGGVLEYKAKKMFGYESPSVSQQISALARNSFGVSNGVSAQSVLNSSGGSSSGSDYGAASVPVNYMNADLAAAYGMDSATAYQEALANTAHQREVKDLLAAGLNPVLSAGGGKGAAVFSGDAMMSGGGSSGGSSSAKSAFDSGVVIPLIAGLADYATTKKVGSAIKTATSAKGLVDKLF